MKQSTIWLVIEQATELTYQSFELYGDAIAFILLKRYDNDPNKFELIEIPFTNYKP